MKDDLRKQCVATTKANRRCRNFSLAGSDYCYLHQPAAGMRIGDQPEGVGVVAKENDGAEREELIRELEILVTQLEAVGGGMEPSPLSVERIIKWMGGIIGSIPEGLGMPVPHRLRAIVNEDLLDIDTWRGVAYMARHTVEYQSGIVKRQIRGDVETDEWGFDWEFLELIRPMLDFLYRYYWRVETHGIEHIPDYGGVLLASNYAGLLSWDGPMIMTAVLNEHPAQRLVRVLYGEWLTSKPVISAILSRLGQSPDTIDNGVRLLQQGEVVCVFPEGAEGMAKDLRSWHKLGRFGNGDFVSVALKARAPIIPVAVIGSEDTHIPVTRSRSLGRLTGMPYFPITLRFPLLGPLGAMPLPGKWHIEFGEPIELPVNAGDENNLTLIAQLTDQVRYAIKDMIASRESKTLLTRRRLS